MIPDLPELPEVQDHSLMALGRRNTLQRPLPAIGIDIDHTDLLGYNIRQIEAERFQQAVAVAYEISRRQNAVSRMRAAYLDRALQYQAERKRGWWR